MLLTDAELMKSVREGDAEDTRNFVEEALRLAGGLRRSQVRRYDRRRSLAQRLGLPGAGMGPPSVRWIVELEGWLRSPRVMML